MTLTIWHNPRCSKSRQTLALLQEAGHAPVERLYLKEGPSRTEVEALAAALGRPVIEMMRPKDALFKELGLSADMDEGALSEAIVAHPALLERPIVVLGDEGRGDKAAIGRPPEAVLALF